MSRANPLPPEERRRALVEATRPLLLAHGPDVSTRQIAEAAGVAEGTIFRVFESKADLLHTCLTDALSTETLAAEVAALPPDADLRATVEALARAVVDQLARVRTLLGALGHPGVHVAAPPTDGSPGCPRPDPRALHAHVVDLVTAPLERHADALRVPPRVAAATLLAFAFGATHQVSGDASLADPPALTDLLLHGLSRSNPC